MYCAISIAYSFKCYQDNNSKKAKCFFENLLALRNLLNIIVKQIALCYLLDNRITVICCGNTFRESSDEFETIKINMQTGTWKNKWISLLLCIFFGWLGIHRFYEGKVVTGILYLFTLGFFGVGWIIDIIRIVQKPNPYRAK